MKKAQVEQVIHLKTRSQFRQDVTAFLVDRQARGLSKHTLTFYRQELSYLADFLEDHHITDPAAVTADLLRRYLLALGEHRNPGGVHAAYRAMRAFFTWYEVEADPDGWTNPMVKVTPPKRRQEPLEPVGLGDLGAMLKTCGKDFTGTRDRAMLLSLLDTGCRASEFVALDVADVNLGTEGTHSGAVTVRQGKGGKSRVTFLGAKSRKELTRYLRLRADPCPALWVTDDGHRLTYAGLRQVVKRRAGRAGVPIPGLHSFRRAFALLSLRGGMDVYSLQKLMGHADLSVLRRYLAQTQDDLAAAHAKSGPVDNLLGR